MKEIAIDLKSKDEGGLDPEEFQRKYNKSKAEMRKDLGASEGFKMSFKEFAEEVNEWGVLPSTITEAEYQGKKVELNKPKRGGSAKYYVYVKDPKSGNIRKVSFGAKGGGGKLAVKIKDPKARKAFADRHNCDTKKDRTKAGYWSCNLPRYAKQLGMGSNMNTFW